jgi:hypothetical protein
MNFIGALALEGKKFTWSTNDRLRRALELKLFEDKKDTIKFTSVVSNVVDRETQEKIDAVKTRLMRDFGYDEISAQNVLEYVELDLRPRRPEVSDGDSWLRGDASCSTDMQRSYSRRRRIHVVDAHPLVLPKRACPIVKPRELTLPR